MISPPNRRIFISYSTPDQACARDLEQHLAPHAWVDIYEIEVGAIFLSDIAESIERSTDFVLLWSAHSKESTWVKFEVHMAFIRWMEDKAITLRIVQLDETPLPLYLRPFSQARTSNPADIAQTLLDPPSSTPRPRSFLNRNIEIGILENALFSNTMMVWVWGMPGIGKRTLAYAAARRFRPSLGQVLRIEVRPGQRETELNMLLAAALKTVPIDSPSNPLPEWVEGDQFQKASDDANALLDSFARAGGLWIFEDAQHWLDEDAAPNRVLLSIFDCLSNADCGQPDRLAIFTSSRKPTLTQQWLSKSQIIRLEGLPTIFAEALLLARGTPKNARSRVPDVARQLDGHPLAIEMAAPRLGDDTLDWDEFRVQVATELIGGAPIADTTRKVLEVLAAADGPFPGEHVADHLGIDWELYQTSVKEAVSFALVSENDEGYLRLHVLVREYFLRRLLALPDWRERCDALAARSQEFLNGLRPGSPIHIKALMTTFRLYSLAGNRSRALSLRSDLAGLLYEGGVRLYQIRQYGQALEYFDEVCRQDPRDERAQLFRARCLAYVNRMDEARQLVDGMLAQRPNDHIALRVRGRLEYVAGNWRDAIRFYERAAELRPDYAPSLRDLAKARMRVNNWDGARSALEEALVQGGATAIDLSGYADILEAQGDRIRARELLEKALRMEPRDDVLLRQIDALNRFDLFSFDFTKGVAIVVPQLVTGEGEAVGARHGPQGAAIVATDVRAAQAIERALIAAHWPHDRVDTELANSLEQPDTRNLVLIRGPMHNRVTASIVLEAGIEMSTGLRFEEYSLEEELEIPRRRLVMTDTIFESPSYGEESERNGSSSTVPGVFHDYAAIVRIPNPWNSRAKVMIIAGIRSFGTLGAAEFVLAEGSSMAQKTEGRDFIAIVSIEREGGRNRVARLVKLDVL